MNRQNVEIMQDLFNNAHGMIMQFIEACPDTVWQQTYGGFTVWQQAYHTLGCYAFFGQDESHPFPTGFFGEEESDIVMFKKEPSAPTRQRVKEFGQAVKIAADQFFMDLDDAALTKKHEGLSAKVGRDMANLAVATLFTSHTMYHLGGCDAALRGNGLPGIF